MKVNTCKHIRCSTKRGYTLVELMVVIVILGIVTAFGANLFVGTIKDFRDNDTKSIEAVSDLKMIAYIDGLLQGCDSIDVSNAGKTLEIRKNGGVEIFEPGKFGKQEEDVRFIKDSTKLTVLIGGEEYCLKALLKEQNEGV